MKIGNTGYEIVKGANGYMDNFRSKEMTVEQDTAIIAIIDALYARLRVDATPSVRDNIFRDFCNNNPVFAALFGTTAEAVVDSAEEILRDGIQKIMNFFTEFDFEPNYRFMNTLSHYLKRSDKDGKGYVTRYFELINSPYSNAINEKMKSAEFTDIISKLQAVAPNKTVNSRFKIYYGSQGTGKTTQALTESNGKCIVCHSAMLPSDLMEDFKFDAEGHAQFVPSELWRCMVEGRTIVLDEINLLPFESLRFLQGLLDGKSSIIYKGQEVQIKDGFMIIGTMNLTVNGMTYGLPEPLIDRCAETKKFNLTAENLMSAII